jgi:hypothetical protein
MAYARFSALSQVWVVVNENGFSCLNCAFLSDGPPWQRDTETAAAMIAHLLSHRAAGHLVPDDALIRLNEDA